MQPDTVTRRKLLQLVIRLGGGACVASLLAACGPSNPPPVAQPTSAPAATPAGNLGYIPHTDIQGNITFWHFWSSPVRRNAIRRVVGSFQQQYPGIKVTETAIPFGDIWNKNIAAVAAGSGMPDVIVEDRPQLPDRAKNNIETNLGEMAKADNIDSKLFWPFTWEQATVDGQPYGLPYETDIRVLYWNKAAFKDAGLDPEKPPANWDDLWSYADKLDQKTGDKLERVGFHPLFGNMDLDQWAWNDGGQWMDPKTKKFTLNDKHNVETLDWIKKWSDRYGKANWEAFRGTFGQGNQDGFMSGRVAMMVDIAGYTSFLNFFNPNLSTKDKERLGWGVAPIPPAPGHQPASLSGGFALSIPRGAKNPKPAWEFIKYAVFQGQASWARDTYSIPTIEKLAKEDPTLNGDPNWQFFVKAMDYGRAGDFNPYYPRWSDLLGPARDAVLDGKMTSQQALDEAQQKAEAEARRNGAPD